MHCIKGLISLPDRCNAVALQHRRQRAGLSSQPFHIALLTTLFPSVAGCANGHVHVVDLNSGTLVRALTCLELSPSRSKLANIRVIFHGINFDFQPCHTCIQRWLP